MITKVDHQEERNIKAYDEVWVLRPQRRYSNFREHGNKIFSDLTDIESI